MKGGGGRAQRAGRFLTPLSNVYPDPRFIQVTCPLQTSWGRRLLLALTRGLWPLSRDKAKLRYWDRRMILKAYGEGCPRQRGASHSSGGLRGPRSWYGLGLGPLLAEGTGLGGWGFMMTVAPSSPSHSHGCSPLPSSALICYPLSLHLS